MPIFENNDRSNHDLAIVNGTVMWTLNPGEIARRINVNEFAHLQGAKGVYVQEGVVAVLMLDGKITTMLSSGVYYFQTGIEKFGEDLKHIWRFFTGKKQGSANEYQLNGGLLGSELQKIGKSALVDVILFAEGAIPVIFGTESSESGYIFKPLTVKTKMEDVDVALSMHLEFSDFSAFRKNYLTTRPYYRIADLQKLLVEPIRQYLNDALAFEVIEASVLSPALKERIRKGLSEKINAILYGISVRQIIDISANSEDFDRFRELEHMLYCSEKDLKYRIRTNDFKNRLASEDNSQKIREARTKEDLRYALKQLNKDALLHDDEIEAFCQLLASQKAIREAQTDEDREKALQEIRKNTLIREDEFEDLQYELKKNHDNRAEVDLILHWQRFRRTEQERISAEKEIALLTADSQLAIENAEYKVKKQGLDNEIDFQTTAAEAQAKLNAINRGEQIKEAETQVSISNIIHNSKIQQDLDWIRNANEQERLENERLREKQQIALYALAAMREQDRADKAQDNAHEEAMAKMEYEAQKALIEAQKGMTADQIAALGISDLAPEAQVALAAALGSAKELEYLKRSSEERVAMLKDLMEQSRGIERESRGQQKEILEQMMRFMAEALKTNASVVSGAVSGQRESVESTLNTMRDISTHRLNEVESDKREAKGDARHAQSRLDHTQDTALHYTTKLGSAEVASDAVKSGGSILTYKLLTMPDDVVLGLADIYAMMQHGQVGPDTELVVNGQTYKAYDRPELKAELDTLYSVECPNCQATGLKGHLCPECKKQL